jgi:hypothetical protein
MNVQLYIPAVIMISQCIVTVPAGAITFAAAFGNPKWMSRLSLPSLFLVYGGLIVAFGGIFIQVNHWF